MILEIVELRARRARLLGYADHAEYVIAEETAPDPAAVDALLRELGAAAMAAVEVELARSAETFGGPLEPWDVTYASAGGSLSAGGAVSPEKPVEPSRDRSPLEEFEQYCELDTVLRDGVFAAAAELYGLTFTERPDLRGYHSDVRVWEVASTRAPASPGSAGGGDTAEGAGAFGGESAVGGQETGRGIGLFLGDFYARPSKRGGAWMNNVVDQSSQLGTRPVIVNVLNLTEPEPGAPCLLSRDQLTTLFHEFGHALHGLLSTVEFGSQSGTSVPRDFVEFPSQVNEMWALHPDVVLRYARHWKTGEPAPAELIAAVREADDVESAHGTVEYLAAAALDLAWHRLTPETIPDDVLAFESAALTAAGLAHPLIPPRYRSTYFNHVFGGGYSSAYYSYIWSEILDAETEQWFLRGGGLRRDLGQAFADAVLSRGDSVDPVAAHAEMLGRAAEITPLLRRRGLVVTEG
ncbi:M3 family metallopeptidase [Gordonia sp. (in: high G+C Gram-positive bacteria)]|uniref:M3 family metallopeptidase n=1 Tax=Gordonia sp. (in: high G+C Gram-positive bacteria) TaxID=84139 RepID=UPI0039E39624